MNAVSVRDEIEALAVEEEDNKSGGVEYYSKRDRFPRRNRGKRKVDEVFAARARKRKARRAGIREDNKEDEIISHVGDMSWAITSFTNQPLRDFNMGSLSKSYVQSILMKEVRAELSSAFYALKKSEGHDGGASK